MIEPFVIFNGVNVDNFHSVVDTLRLSPLLWMINLRMTADF